MNKALRTALAGAAAVGAVLAPTNTVGASSEDAKLAEPNASQVSAQASDMKGSILRLSILKEGANVQIIPDMPLPIEGDPPTIGVPSVDIEGKPLQSPAIARFIVLPPGLGEEGINLLWISNRDMTLNQDLVDAISAGAFTSEGEFLGAVGQELQIVSTDPEFSWMMDGVFCPVAAENMPGVLKWASDNVHQLPSVGKVASSDEAAPEVTP